MFTKKLFGVAGAALLMVSGAAYAQINLGATSGSTVKIAQESLKRDDSSQTALPTNSRVKSGTFYSVGTFVNTDDNANDREHITVTANAGVTGTDVNILVRFELTNAVFLSGSNPQLAVGAEEAVGATEGTGVAGQDSVTFAVQDVTVTTATKVVMETASLGIQPGMPVGIKMSIFPDVPGTLISGSATPAHTIERAGVITTAPGIKYEVDMGALIADVESDPSFTRFLTSSTGGGTDRMGFVGKVKVFEDTTLMMANGAPIDEEVDQLVNNDIPATSVATFKGDFSVGSWKITKGTDNNMCGGTAMATVTPKQGNTSEATVHLSHLIDTTPAGTAPALNDSTLIGVGDVLTKVAADGHPNLCVELPRNNDKSIGGDPAVEYSVSFTLPGLTGAVAGPSAFNNQAIGSIGRNGTSIRAPYLTTFDGYNQRLIMVNHGRNDVDYSTEFRPENNVTATPGMYASGTLVAGETKVIRVKDAAESPGMVTLSGGTRTAAVINFVAAEANIDVAVTQVNLEDGSTDTVVLSKN